MCLDHYLPCPRSLYHLTHCQHVWVDSMIISNEICFIFDYSFMKYELACSLAIV